MLIEFGRKGTTFLSNTDILGLVFCSFFKNKSICGDGFFSHIKKNSTFALVNSMFCPYLVI